MCPNDQIQTQLTVQRKICPKTMEWWMGWIMKFCAKKYLQNKWNLKIDYTAAISFYSDRSF